MTDNATAPLNEWGRKDGKRQALGLNLAVYHINEGSRSTEPGDNNQSQGMQICLHSLPVSAIHIIPLCVTFRSACMYLLG